MIKKFTSLFCGLLMSSILMAQLPSGSIAPDFTATDINGKTWNLYEILDSGKSVVLDVSATWCGPCWSYHTSGTLDRLHEMYGPDGTDEMVVIMIEGDANTPVECLYGDCENTLGDWTDGVHYPIIDNADIAEAYEITYYPTLYHICQNRIVTEFEQVGENEIYALNDNCVPAFGDNNMGILQYTGEQGKFCGTGSFTPSVLLQNLGNQKITEAELELSIDGAVVETNSWSGDLSTFQTASIFFDEVMISQSTDFEIEVVSVNGIDDEDNSNNQITVSTQLVLDAQDNYITLELLTDDFSEETYWEILDENGNAYYTGGNAQVVGGTNNYSTLEPNTLHTSKLPIPKDGCFEFKIYDAFSDGIFSQDFGEGYYKLIDSDGTVLFEGGQFGEVDVQPFGMQSGGKAINNNATIVDYSGESGNFCFDLNYNPEITIQNVGTNEITSLQIDAATFSGLQYTYDWSGSIASGGYGFISDLPEVIINESGPLFFSIRSVNGETDTNEYKNIFAPDFERRSAKTATLDLEMQIDEFGYEAYWELVNSSGQVVASGGNEVVRDSGGGAQIATENDPGAYGAMELVKETITLPNTTDCYTFRLLDDYADGMASFSVDTYFSLIDDQGISIYDNESLLINYSEFSNPVGIEGATSVNELEEVNELTLYPNPSSNEITIDFETTESLPVEIAIFNVVGKRIRTIANQTYSTGNQRITTNVSDLTNGMYYIQMANESGKLIEKFTVLH